MSGARALRIPARRLAIFVGLWAAMPLLGVAYQIAAKSLALELDDAPFDWAWLGEVLTSYWMIALIVIELVSFVVWMSVLSELQLSAAVLLSSLGYVLVLAAGVILFGETISALELTGSAAILIGIALVGREDISGKPHPPRADAAP